MKKIREGLEVQEFFLNNKEVGGKIQKFQHVSDKVSFRKENTENSGKKITIYFPQK